MSPELSNAVAAVWFLITVLGWVPLIGVLRAHNRRAEATLLLFIGAIYAPLMALFAFAVVSGPVTGEAGGRGTAQFRLELAGLTLLAALAGLLIGVAVTWRRWKDASDRSLLVRTLVASTLTGASLNLIALFVVGPIIFGLLALFAR